MKDEQKAFLDRYRSVRKKMPPPEKVIRPKVEYERDQWDWKREMEEAEDEYRDINRNDSNSGNTGHQEVKESHEEDTE